MDLSDPEFDDIEFEIDDEQAAVLDAVQKDWNLMKEQRREYEEERRRLRSKKMLDMAEAASPSRETRALAQQVAGDEQILDMLETDSMQEEETAPAWELEQLIHEKRIALQEKESKEIRRESAEIARERQQRREHVLTRKRGETERLRTLRDYQEQYAKNPADYDLQAAFAAASLKKTVTPEKLLGMYPRLKNMLTSWYSTMKDAEDASNPSFFASLVAGGTVALAVPYSVVRGGKDILVGPPMPSMTSGRLFWETESGYHALVEFWRYFTDNIDRRGLTTLKVHWAWKLPRSPSQFHSVFLRSVGFTVSNPYIRSGETLSGFVYRDPLCLGLGMPYMFATKSSAGDDIELVAKQIGEDVAKEMGARDRVLVMPQASVLKIMNASTRKLANGRYRSTRTDAVVAWWYDMDAQTFSQGDSRGILVVRDARGYELDSDYPVLVSTPSSYEVAGLLARYIMNPHRSSPLMLVVTATGVFSVALTQVAQIKIRSAAQGARLDLLRVSLDGGGVAYRNESEVTLELQYGLDGALQIGGADGGEEEYALGQDVSDTALERERGDMPVSVRNALLHFVDARSLKERDLDRLVSAQMARLSLVSSSMSKFIFTGSDLAGFLDSASAEIDDPAQLSVLRKVAGAVGPAALFSEKFYSFGDIDKDRSLGVLFQIPLSV